MTVVDSHPVSLSAEATVHNSKTEDSYYFEWLNNPCGVTRLVSDQSYPIDGEEDYAISSLILQLVVTLDRLRYWIDTFVSIIHFIS